MTTSKSIETKTIPFGGILLILLGIYILLEQILDIQMKGGIFLAALGLIFILWGSTQHKAGLLIPGGILTGMSIGIMLVEDSGTIPTLYSEGVFLLALGAGFGLVKILVHLFTTEKYWWAVIVASILALLGSGLIILEMPDTHAIKHLIEVIFTGLQYLWPLALILLGIIIILKRR